MATYDISLGSGTVDLGPVRGREIGVQVLTNITFNGGTTTVTLQGSNDNLNWSDATDINDKEISFTLTVAEFSDVDTSGFAYKFLRANIVEGDATVGIITVLVNVA